MQYLGGKSKIAKWLCACIKPARQGRVVWDAFCGGLSISAELSKTGPVLTTDANVALISLYQAVANGWDPPAAVTEEQYKAGRALPDTDPMKAFLGFGCSFGGKWFGGFARNKENRGYAHAARNSLLEDVGAITRSGGVIAFCDFLEKEPSAEDAEGTLLYLDPPYQGTTGYGATGNFDYVKFYERVRGWAEFTDVFVSEYALPVTNLPLMEFAHDMSVAGGVQKEARRERLYRFGPMFPWVDA